MSAHEILTKYIEFFKKREHVQIANASLVPDNDPTTLFTSSGMQPLVPYLLGEVHPQGKRLVNAQNCFRAQDIEEIGDNRHTTFFRMLGNWSLGDYFKKEQLPFFFTFLTDKNEGLGLDPQKLFVTVFARNDSVPKDTESIEIWQELFQKVGIDAKEGERIFTYGVDKNWWSRSGKPDNMPAGEPGGPDSEVFYDFGAEYNIHENSQWKDEVCHVNCDCGRYIEIGNSVFMQFQKQSDGSFQELPQLNVDFGGGLERLLMASENKTDIFETSLFEPVIASIKKAVGKDYKNNENSMRIITDHLTAAVFITSNGTVPSNKEQGYILRRLIRRGLDNFYVLGGKDVRGIIESIIEQYKKTDPELIEKFEQIHNVILEEEQKYSTTRTNAKSFIERKYSTTAKDSVVKQISADDAFILYSTHGLSPTQIKSLGYIFDDQAFAEKMKSHQNLSRAGADKKFKGGLADTQERTIHGHTATHLLHQALRDVLGDSVHQTGSNITTERVRFDFSYDKKVTLEELKKVEDIVNEKISKNLLVHFEILPIEEAKKKGAIGLFGEKYAEDVKVYFIGDYSAEFCGGPHVEHTSVIGSFKITREESLGKGNRRIYAIVE
jgi:alanyl-tRNA synthetase